MTRLPLLLALVFLLAGCTSPAPLAPSGSAPAGPTAPGSDGGAAPPPVSPAVPAPPAAYEFVCPGEHGTSALPTLAPCHATLSVAARGLGEPFVAVSPRDARVVAIAANAQPDLALFVSDDGARSFRTVALPPLPARGAPAQLFDPVLAFDASGALHFVGLASAENGGYDVFHVASRDLGASWGEVTLVTSAGTADRPWMVVAPDGSIVVTWQDDGARYARSVDGGTSWARGNVEDGCVGTARPVVAARDGAILTACVVLAEGAPSAIDVLRLDVANGTAERVTRVPTRASWPTLAFVADGSLALVTEDYLNESVALRWSRDGGASWGSPVDVRGLAAFDDAWGRAYAHWVEPDPWGGLHVVLGGVQGTPLEREQPSLQPRRNAFEFTHLVLRADGSLLMETSLRALASPAAPAPGALPPVGSDYVGLAFDKDGGWLAWPQDGAVAYTRVVPRP